MYQQIRATLAMWLFIPLVCGCAQEMPDVGGVQKAEVNPPQAESKWPAKLSAGVALPQTLPDGTQIGFSVDYRFHDALPGPQAQYVWEIRQGDGSVEQLSVQITSAKGTLSQFLPLRPEAGPFSTRLCVIPNEEGQLTPLTDWVSMQ